MMKSSAFMRASKHETSRKKARSVSGLCDKDDLIDRIDGLRVLVVFVVFFGDGVHALAAAAAGFVERGLGFEFPLADAITDHGAEGVSNELVHADVKLPADVVKLGKFIDGEFDGDGAIHFLGDPIGNIASTTFPMDDG